VHLFAFVRDSDTERRGASRLQGHRVLEFEYVDPNTLPVTLKWSRAGPDTVIVVYQIAERLSASGTGRLFTKSI